MADIPRSEDFYSYGAELYAVHYRAARPGLGNIYAVFTGPNEAMAFWRGLDAEGREYFHIENAKGERVTLLDNPRASGHASAILETLRSAL